jgi:hypothetical protein
VDAKAAIRYLRYNDDVMPGSAERIISEGTSGGGALSSLIGATGNVHDFDEYLEEIGAEMDVGDDVFASVAYCPIIDLENADKSYEWLYNGTRKTVNPLTDAKMTISEELASAFPSYQASLNLYTEGGEKLTTDNYLDVIEKIVIISAEDAFASGVTIPALGEPFVIPGMVIPGIVEIPDQSFPNDWIELDKSTGKVTFFDIDKYLFFVAMQAALKSAPAFDCLGVEGADASAENNVFGTADIDTLNFTEYSWNKNLTNSKKWGISQVAKQVAERVELINPMNYIDNPKADTTAYWYVRHGTRDRDTAFTVPINLYYKLLADKNRDGDVREINFKLAWDKPHAGNYDQLEVLAWIKSIVATAENPE